MAYETDMPASEHEVLWWEAWRALDYSWQGLAAKPGHGTDSLQAVWAQEADRLIAEPGTTRLWTRWHCPFVFADGSPSPKASWPEETWRDLRQGLRTRLAMGTQGRPCRLDGIVIDGLYEGESELPDAADFLWLRAPYMFVRGHADLRCAGLALFDSHGAWFGGGVDLTGARVLERDRDDVVVPPVTVMPEAVAVPERVAPVVVKTRVEPVVDAPVASKSRKGLWAVVGVAALAVAAGAAWLLHGL